VARRGLAAAPAAHPEDLDLLLLTAATGRKVQRDGIRFASTRYVSPVLAAYVGETVTVRYDPRDAAELRVYHHEQYLCRAIAPELAADTVTLQQLQQARTARRRQLKQQLRDRRSLADALPDDQRHLPAMSAPMEVATGPEPGLAPVPPAPPTAPPAHRLRTYATD
jgi:putative transposase